MYSDPLGDNFVVLSPLTVLVLLFVIMWFSLLSQSQGVLYKKVIDTSNIKDDTKFTTQNNQK